jgi:NAD(P)-dependent dehydrogenase (short-subunit alcohol dehydrogenase family)
MQELSGRGAVVIGGGSGVGRSIALALGAQGALVLIGDIDGDTAKETAQMIIAAGGNAAATQVDATDRDALADVARLATAELGRVHVLVETVGILYDASVLDSDEKIWGWFTEFHLMAMIRVIDTFVPLIKSHGEGGHVVITSSSAGLLTLPPSMTSNTNIGVYTTLKFGVLGYGEMLRHELAEDDIGVSVLCPGALNTNLGRTSARNRPERFGGPYPYHLPGELKEGEMPLGNKDPEVVGPAVVKGIKANRAHVFTHPEMVDLIQARQQEILDDFAFFADDA